MIIRSEKLSEICDWCLALGVKEVTVYAFSIENFNRSQEEVDDLMNLVKTKLEHVLERCFLSFHVDKFRNVFYAYYSTSWDKRNIRIEVMGNMSLLPKENVQLLAKILEKTKSYKKLICNICLCYTCMNDI